MASFVFPKVKLKKPKRSLRALNCNVDTTFAAGPLYPIKDWDLLPSDDFEIRVSAAVESFPMAAPTIGKWKLSFDFYKCDWKNYYSFMANNDRDSIREILNRNRWVMGIGAFFHGAGTNKAPSVGSLSNNTVCQSSIFDYMGIPPGFFGWMSLREEDIGEDQPEGFTDIEYGYFSAETFISYIDVVRNFYVNNQEQQTYYCIDDQVSVSGGIQSYYEPVSVDTLDYFIKLIRNAPEPFDIFDRDNDGLWRDVAPARDSVMAESVADFMYVYYHGSIASPLGGLFLRTYKMDLMRGIMNVNIDDYQSFVEVEDSPDTGGQVVSITALRYANKLQQVIDLISLSGGRFKPSQKVRWNVEPNIDDNLPIYVGSFSTIIGQRDVTNQTALPDVDPTITMNNALGSKAGVSVGGFGFTKKAIRVKSSNYGTLLCIMSMVPYVTYSQGIPLNRMKTTFAEIYEPTMARLGYQDVSRAELSALPNFRPNASLAFLTSYPLSSNSPSQSVGKRVAWAEYMGDVSRAHGLFAYGEMLDYWVLNRVYTPISGSDNLNEDSYLRYGIFDSSTYVRPGLWNRLFVDTTEFAQNFRIHIEFQVDAWRPIGKRLLPNL